MGRLIVAIDMGWSLSLRGQFLACPGPVPGSKRSRNETTGGSFPKR
jgi:hypothetical protein